MTNKEISKLKQELYAIQSTPNIDERFKGMIGFTERIKALGPSQMVYFELVNDQMQEMPYEAKKRHISESARNIYLMLHTEMMFNSCVSAERACIWAAVAAGVSLLGTAATWITIFKK
jgi:hypothetical protein